jgi:hypothetical protein
LHPLCHGAMLATMSVENEINQALRPLTEAILAVKDKPRPEGNIYDVIALSSAVALQDVAVRLAKEIDALKAGGAQLGS